MNNISIPVRNLYINRDDVSTQSIKTWAGAQSKIVIKQFRLDPYLASTTMTGDRHMIDFYIGPGYWTGRNIRVSMRT